MDKKTIEFEAKNNLKNLSKSDFKLISKSEIIQQVTVVGKPEKAFTGFLKRFFSNPFTVIALIIFLFILMTSIIAPLASPYNGTDPISKTSGLLTTYLPPKSLHGGKITLPIKNDTDIIIQILNRFIKMHKGNNDLINSLGVKISSTTGLVDTNSLFHGNVGSVTFNPFPILDASDHTNHNPLLGTDAHGRDIWTRLWIGTRDSLAIALAVAITETIIGVSIGAYIGYHAGTKVDIVLMRIIEILYSVPSLIWFILMIFVLPKMAFWTIFLALVTIGWMGPIASTRMFVMRIKDAEFVKSAQAIGCTQKSLIFNHILLNVMGKLATSFVRRIPLVIGMQASLAFLGLSPDPNAPDLGNIINEAKGQIENWWYILSPTLILLVTTISLQLIATGLHDALDPRTGRK
ncbi:MAG: ABC transporter permease [Mycoplasma sp.]|nr:ABC transporter permease [Mycoplasma sp.]